MRGLELFGAVRAVSARSFGPFALAESRPARRPRDRDEMFPVDAVTAVADAGRFCPVFQAGWGRSGCGFASLCVAIEEIFEVGEGSSEIARLVMARSLRRPVG
jgi:alkylation response protein AidB-like acyl-CoA dehydrogenase